MLYYLINGKPPTIGPVDDKRIDTPIVGNADIDANVLLPGSVYRYVTFVV